MTLTDFLFARIAEDEAEITRMESEIAARMERYSGASFALPWFHTGRLLAECEAKRRIVEEHAMWQPTGYRYTNGKQIDVCSVDEQHFPCRTLRLLALPYADHPDYREEWKP